MRYRVYQSIWTRLFYAQLLEATFDNCYGQGSTEKAAIASLKIRLHQLKNKKQNEIQSNKTK